MRWFLLFILFMCCITCSNSHLSNHPVFLKWWQLDYTVWALSGVLEFGLWVFYSDFLYLYSLRNWSFIVMSFFYFVIMIILAHRFSLKVLLSFVFCGKVCGALVLLLFKRCVEFSSPGLFFVGKIFATVSIAFSDMSIAAPDCFHFHLFKMCLSILSFQAVFLFQWGAFIAGSKILWVFFCFDPLF